MYTPAGTHNPTNVGTGRIDAILIEFKAAAPGKATIPASREGMSMKVLAEGPRAIGLSDRLLTRSSRKPAGSKHDYDQVVIALAPVADFAGDRRQAGENDVGARRRAVHWARHGARDKEHRRQAGRFCHRGDQVATPAMLR